MSALRRVIPWPGAKITSGNGRREGIADNPGVLGVLTDRFPVLSETFVANEIDELHRLGYGVIIEANERPAEAVPTDSTVTYLDDDRVLRKPDALLELALRNPQAVNRDRASQPRWA